MQNLTEKLISLSSVAWSHDLNGLWTIKVKMSGEWAVGKEGVNSKEMSLDALPALKLGMKAMLSVEF